jgi:hypothetical protein
VSELEETMKTKILCILLSLSCSLAAVAADFEIRVLSAPPKLPLGAPVTVTAEVMNASGHPITVAYGYHGFRLVISVGRADGKPIKGLQPGPSELPAARYTLETLPPGWTKVWSETFTCTEEPAKWVAIATLSSQGPYRQRKLGSAEEEELQAWSGSGRSAQQDILVEEPVGIDRNAYVSLGKCPTCNTSKLLRDFPTSTYAAYVIYGRMSGFMQWEPTEEKRKMFAAGIEAGGWFSNAYPDETGKIKDGSVWLKGQAAADWWAKWYDIILKNHPDIWFADELRLKKAVDQLCLKNYQAAEADISTLAKDPKSPVQAKAQLVLDLMKQKGWIKGGQ